MNCFLRGLKLESWDLQEKFSLKPDKESGDAITPRNLKCIKYGEPRKLVLITMAVLVM